MGTMFCRGRFFRRKFIIFLFWCVNSIVHLNSYFSMQAAEGAILFCEVFHGDPILSVQSTFMNSMAILWQIWRIYCECFKNNSSNFSLNFIHFLGYLKIYIMAPTFYFIFQKYKATLTILLKFIESLIVKYFLLLAKLLNLEIKIH